MSALKEQNYESRLRKEPRVTRYDYRLNCRRETLNIGRYGPAGVSLALPCEKLIDAKKAVAQRKSPALGKQREKRRLTAAKTFGEVTEKWLTGARTADSTKAMCKSIVDRGILPVFENRQLKKITADDLRALCNKVKALGAPATAVHIRDIVKQVYAFAILHGEKMDNPAADVGAASIATFMPKDRALSPLEIRLMARQMELVATYPTIRRALRMILQTPARKSELIQASREEVAFENATLNWVTQIVTERAKAAGLPPEPFTVHTRRTGLALLNEIGFKRDWIEKGLAHEGGRSSRSKYNKAEYAEQRRRVLQQRANMVDARIDGQVNLPTLVPEIVVVPALSATV